jgi:5-methylthioribose kinase
VGARSARYDVSLLDLNAGNAPDYLTSRGLQGPWRITPLGGGVSNTVLLAESSAQRLVLKQSLARLRVEQEWLSDRSRICRESAAIQMLAPHLSTGSLPSVVFEDPGNFLYAMEAAPPHARDWKSLLLAGIVSPQTAEAIGAMLASMISVSWHQLRWEQAFGDQTVFDQLRLDPYYRATARRHPDLCRYYQGLIDSCSERRVSFVHGDWSPKNFLVAGDSVLAIDFEVAHFGDPSFDSAFLLNHLALKSFFRPDLAVPLAEAADRFWTALRSGMPSGADWFETATIAHLGGLMLARIDGKSPAEYIREEDLRQRIRGFARGLMSDPPATAGKVFDRLQRS